MTPSYKIAAVCAAIAAGLPMTSCLEETYPTNLAVSDQVASDLEGLTYGMSAYMTVHSTGTDYLYNDIGFAAFMLERDCMLADAPVADTGYDYFTYFASQEYLGNYQLQNVVWYRYYYLVNKANLVLGVADQDPAGFDAPYVGDALVYRATAYHEMMNMYEYRPTGVGRLDNFAETNGIYGLTVPIVTEETTEQQSRSLPRAPYYEMYRFILNDLNNATACLSRTHQASNGKTHACLGTAYGALARLWLDIASRFYRHPDQMAEALSHETDEKLSHLMQLGVTSANEAFANAAYYARLAIAEGFTPVTKTQWYDTKTGFNSPNNSWMWCITISPSDGLTDLSWRSFISFVCSEATWGVAHPDYGANRCIDARLWRSVQQCDWRRETWIAPGDAGNEVAYTAKYADKTNLPYADWARLKSYSGNKYHPNAGDCNTSKNGIAISIPLMRVEEMYFIEAEALCHTQGAAAGKQALESFMNTYRTEGGNYACQFSGLDEVIDEIFNQKRIELWCEGRVYFDYKRLEKAIIRGYEGTNTPEMFRFNSYPDHIAPWTIYYIPDAESHEDTAIKLNPDPSQAIPKWEQ